MVVLHYTAMTHEAGLARLCDPEFEVSAHWLIAPDGTALALVPEERRAWHAGAGAWGDARDVNSRSIGIELSHRGTHPFPAAQMAGLERLLSGITARWAIPPERVIAHSDMAPGRKSDPGPRFDWRRLALAGLSVWPDPRAAQGDFDALARAFGYVPPEDGGAEVVLRAFRSRFRPWALEAGASGPEDVAAIADLAARYPVDRTRGRG
ncbi:N-acetylmuramoyl-L-alanine amidase [Pseudoroseicyclus aestuarii]|uniref:N-acetylmuramoyl-L-alanine amidase n=1 Tax=Pseudoroseicyclus aestuarii TaxID=1795041 RepID=A0A318TBH9_9RHOB|nr:N-acetylmuramoyl-L-alanine amidase [Pseudoroseicyclus aestuarii]PYE85688.1 N-acetylmuramoyl-L-alanine amidase [Pseudoroseicyclus aestuarii]